MAKPVISVVDAFNAAQAEEANAAEANANNNVASVYEDVVVDTKRVRALGHQAPLFQGCPVGKSFVLRNEDGTIETFSSPASMKQRVKNYGKRFGYEFRAAFVVENGQTVARVQRIK